MIKAALTNPSVAQPGDFRATFEKQQIGKSDLVFLRSFVAVDLPKYYNPVLNRLCPIEGEEPSVDGGWRLMRTLNELRQATGTKPENRVDSQYKRLLRPTKRQKLLEKRKRHKELFGKLYEEAAGGPDAAAFYDKLVAAKEAQLAANRAILQSLPEEALEQLEGFPPGTYVRLEFEGVPHQFIDHFNPCQPLVAGGLPSAEESKGFLQVRFRTHRWLKRVLRSNDPITVSIGWRRYQTVGVFSKEEHNLRNRFLKYSLPHEHCLATIYGPLVPAKTGVVFFVNSAWRPQSDTSGLPTFRVAGTGSVTSTDQSFQVMKKLKLIGEPYKIFSKTAFVRGMFNSALEVSKMIGVRIQTVSNVRDQLLADYELNCMDSHVHRQKLLEKRKRHKELFGKLYEEAAGGPDAAAFYDKLVAAKEAQLAANRAILQSLPEEALEQLEGFPPGTYVRLEFEGVPHQFIDHFNPCQPLVAGGLPSAEESKGFLQVRFRTHRWLKRVLRSNDPITVSIGWRRYQTVGVFSKEEHNLRNRFLKYSLPHEHCLATIYGPLVPAKTGVVFFVNSAWRPQSDTSGLPTFRVAGTGSVTSTDQSFQVMKKLKLIGEPYKIFSKTAFVRGMFNSALEVSKMIGVRIQTVSNVRGKLTIQLVNSSAQSNVKQTGTPVAGGLLYATNTSHSSSGVVELSDHDFTLPLHLDSPLAITSVDDWLKPEMSERVANRFTTGQWDPSEDAKTLLQSDLEARNKLALEEANKHVASAADRVQYKPSSHDEEEDIVFGSDDFNDDEEMEKDDSSDDDGIDDDDMEAVDIFRDSDNRSDSDVPKDASDDAQRDPNSEFEKSNVKQTGTPVAGGLLYATNTSHSSSGVVELSDHDFTLPLHLDSPLAITSVDDWLKPEMSERVANRFTTGQWDPSEDAKTLLQSDLEARNKLALEEANKHVASAADRVQYKPSSHDEEEDIVFGSDDFNDDEEMEKDDSSDDDGIDDDDMEAVDIFRDSDNRSDSDVPKDASDDAQRDPNSEFEKVSIRTYAFS
ncbi:hypothetical protein AHF37_02483 [Paragonimus kellicotti]|nr:hypothetical protein AHF37_02483 [Paragonimus kellicotti]